MDTIKIDKSAQTRWNNLNNAFNYYRNYLNTKKPEVRCELTVIDLVFISNFKGGNASITEDNQNIENKLIPYIEKLKQIYSSFSNRKLSALDSLSLSLLIKKCKEFTSLTQKDDTKIKGFGASYASALLAAYFPDLIPILDKRIIKALGINTETHKNGQIKKIHNHYGCVINKMYELAKSNEYHKLSLREIDKHLFSYKTL